MRAFEIEKSRRLVLRAGEGDVLPGDLTRILADQVVICGWMRASGVLADVELRAFDTSRGAFGPSRRIAGPVQVLTLEGSIGLERGELTVGLRAVLGRETDRGGEVLAGEIVSARVVALEATIEAFDDLAVGRALDPAGVTLFADAAAARFRPQGQESSPAASPAPPPAAPKEAPAAWSEAISASAVAEASRPAHARGGTPGGAIPNRIVRAQVQGDDAPLPEAGDIVEHFAFGRAEVYKADGERLHLRVEKDGRIREIALEMLKVSPLESTGPQRRFKLERKL